MATTPPPDFTPAEPEPEQQQPNPWAPLTERGFDPSRYDPDEVVHGANLYKALRSRDYQEGALADVLRHAGFPDGVSVSDLREMARQAQQADPWEQFSPQQPQDEQGYYEPQAPAFDPNMLREAMQAEIDRRFAEHDQRQQEAQRQQAYEAEFTREAERVAKQHGFEEGEMVWLATQANMLRESMPYATTAQVMDAAGKRINDSINQRLQALTQRQQETAPAEGLPPGAVPSSQQVPQSADEARAAARQFFTN